MGKSFSTVNSTSNTSYSNTPQTVQDNGVALNQASLITGQNNNSINGSTLNSLDGGAIASSFGFGSDLIKKVFNAQKENNALISESNTKALDFAKKSQDMVDKKFNQSAEQNNSITRNLVIAAAVAIAFFYFRK